MILQRREFLGAMAGAALGASPRPPNIVYILADDLGYGDVGCYGQKQIATPNIDRMAAAGIRFTQAYSGGTVCAPSRCCLMTGVHTGHARVRSNGTRVTLRPQDLTVTEVLKKAGYHTGLIGKWSLGGLGTPGYPNRKGFDDWFGYFSQTHAHNYYPEHLLENDHAVLLRGNTGTSKEDYTPDLFTDRALHFLKENRARPFFLKVAYTIPHTNNEMARDTGNGMEVPSDEPYSKRDWPQPEKNFAAMITRMDGQIGQILAKVKELGLEGNTYVFFASDNGPHKVGGHSPKFFASAGPLRGIKGDLYEGGVRVPVVVQGPGIRAGQVSEYPWAFWDFLPTAAALAGAPAPAGIDGISVAPLLLGRTQKKHPPFYWEHYSRQFLQAVRVGDWKGVRAGIKGPLELYNLREDLGERNDLAAKNPAMVRELEAVLAASRVASKYYPTDGKRKNKEEEG